MMVPRTLITQRSLRLSLPLTEPMDLHLPEEAQMVMSTNVSKSSSGFNVRSAKKPSKVRSEK